MGEHSRNPIFYSNIQAEPLNVGLVNSDLETINDVTPAEPVSPSKIFPYEYKRSEIPSKPSNEASGASNNKIKISIEKLESAIRLKEKVILKFYSSHSVLNTYREQIRKIAQSSAPFTRHAWITSAELNLDDVKYTNQYITSEDKRLCLTGSAGGSIQEIEFNSKVNIPRKRKIETVSSVPKKSPMTNDFLKKNGLLSSLNVNLKPGPLRKKLRLGNPETASKVAIVTLPRAGLEVFPEVGVRIDPAACKLLWNSRDRDGLIDPAWAEFATSVIYEKGTKPAHPRSHNFIIPYYNNQNKILMQKDPDVVDCRNTSIQPVTLNQEGNEDFGDVDLLKNLNSFETVDETQTVVKEILSDVLSYLHIKETQDVFYKYDEDFIPSENKSHGKPKNSAVKDKNSKKYLELRRLDITIVDFDECEEDGRQCLKEFCRLGCVCESLKNTYMFNQHCGRPSCMFDCDCNFKDEFRRKNDLLDNDFTNMAIFNIQNQINRNLAKEEQKFRRTVIKSNQKTIVMGAGKRGSRAPKKYDDYLNNTYDEKPSKTEKECFQVAKVVLNKLPMKDLNLQVWCMTHHLYKCFCGGKALNGFQFNHSYDLPNVDIGNCNFNNCARTAHFPCFIQRSAQKKVKYTERDVRIKRLKESDLENQKKLKEIMEAASPKPILMNESKTKRKHNETRMPSIHNPLSEENLAKIAKNYYINSDDVTLTDGPPIKDHQYVYSWSALVDDFMLRKKFLWAKRTPPFKLFLFSDNNTFPDNVNDFTYVKKAFSKELMMSYPDFFRELVKGHREAFDAVILTGASDCWEITAVIRDGSQLNTYNQSPINPRGCVDDPGVILIDDDSDTSDISVDRLSSDQEMSVDNNHSHSSDQTIDVESVIPSPAPKTKNSPEVVRRTKTVILPLDLKEEDCRYLKITLKDDFFTMKVPHKYFYVTCDEIKRAFDAVDRTQKIYRIRALKGADGFTEEFGMIFIPGWKNDVLLGPYGMNEKMNVLTKKKAVALNAEKTRGVWIHRAKPQTLTYPRISSVSTLAPQTSPASSTFISLSSSSSTVSKNLPSKHSLELSDSSEEEKSSNSAAVSKNLPSKYQRSSSDSSEKAKSSNLSSRKNAFVSPFSTLAKNISALTSTSVVKSPVNYLLLPLAAKPSSSTSRTVVKKSNLVDNSFTNLSDAEKLASAKLKVTNQNNLQCDLQKKVQPKDTISREKVISLLRKQKMFCGTLFGDSEKESVISNSVDSVEKNKKAEEDSDDDIIFSPNEENIIEISDSEKEEEVEDEPAWFVCTNIPAIGYISAIKHGDGNIEFQLASFGVKQFKNVEDAVNMINSILKSYVGFKSKDLFCTWKMTTNIGDLKNIPQMNFLKLNKSHMITKNGFAKRLP